MRWPKLWSVLFALLVAVWASAGLSAQTAARSDATSTLDAGHGSEEECVTGAICALDAAPATTSAPETSGRPQSERATLMFFWGQGCPHCEQAKPFVERLVVERPGLRVERIEVRNDSDGRKRFVATMRRLGADAVGIPTFAVDDEYVVGFIEGTTEQQVTELVDRALGTTHHRARVPDARVTLPWFGELDATTLSLPAFTLAVGLVDGINPCAMWVLLVLLGILAHVRSTKRLLLVGGTFVVASGVVYFVFMTAWLSLFELIGLSHTLTVVLGAALFGMGLVNLKELVWFKRGLSLTIPDKVKPKLYRKMRSVANAASVPAAFLGVAALAVFVNLIELACTLGLPAVFTRVLSLREELSSLTRVGYLVLYNIAYVVPLAVIVIVYALTLHRLTLTERGAKALKAVSGTLLVVFGGLFMVAPEILGG